MKENVELLQRNCGFAQKGYTATIHEWRVTVIATIQACKETKSKDQIRKDLLQNITADWQRKMVNSLLNERYSKP
jgi:hypothetical protein